MNSNALLRELAIIIGEMDEESREKILRRLEERNELLYINFDILMVHLANAGKIKTDI
jgi:hypothetical protein